MRKQDRQKRVFIVRMEYRYEAPIYAETREDAERIAIDFEDEILDQTETDFIGATATAVVGKCPVEFRGAICWGDDSETPMEQLVAKSSPS